MPSRGSSFCAALLLAGFCHAAETGPPDLAPGDPLAEPSGFLPLGRAFVFSSRTAHAGKPEVLVARWDMPEGYYLYRQHFRVEAGEGVTLGELSLPSGERRTDEYFGESEVYFGSVELSVPVLERNVDTVEVRFAYQGCAEAGFCYPPAVVRAAFFFPTSTPARRWSAWVWATGILGLLLLAAWAMRSRRDVR